MIVGVALAIGVGLWFHAQKSYDAIDRFKIVAIVKDPSSANSALLVNYENGNSSAGGLAIWIVTGAAPPVGSTDPLPGDPALVSMIPISADQIGWSVSHRATLKVAAPVSVSNDLHHCFYDDFSGPTICAGAGMDIDVDK